MNGKVLSLFVIVAVLLALPASALATSSPANTAVIGLSLPTLSDPFFSGLAYGAQATATEIGYDLLVVASDGDADAERANVQSLVDQGVDALLISPVDMAVIDIATAAGVPVFVFGSDVADVEVSDGVVSVIVPDYRHGGYLAGDVLCTAVEGTGTVIELVAEADNIAGYRIEGFETYMSKSCEGVNVVTLDTTGLDRDQVVDSFINLLDDDVAGVFAYNDQMTMTALEATLIARRAGITFVSMGASDEAISALQQGLIEAIVAPVGSWMGAQGVMASEALFNGVDLPDSISVFQGVLNLNGLTAFRSGPGNSAGFETGPGSSSGFEGGPGSSSGFEGGPGSSSGFEGGPGSSSGFEGGPGSSSGFEGGPGSSSGFEGGPGSSSGFEGGPGSSSGFEGGPGSSSGFEGGPGSSSGFETGPGSSSGFEMNYGEGDGQFRCGPACSQWE